MSSHLSLGRVPEKGTSKEVGRGDEEETEQNDPRVEDDEKAGVRDHGGPSANCRRADYSQYLR